MTEPSLPPRAQFGAVVTALALAQGGMTWCDRHLVALEAAQKSLGHLSEGDTLAPLRAASGYVLSARLRGSDVDFDVAHARLRRAVAVYWEAMAGLKEVS